MPRSLDLRLPQQPLRIVDTPSLARLRRRLDELLYPLNIHVAGFLPLLDQQTDRPIREPVGSLEVNPVQLLDPRADSQEQRSPDRIRGCQRTAWKRVPLIASFGQFVARETCGERATDSRNF